MTYKIVRIVIPELEKEINEYTKDGYILHSVVAPGNSGLGGEVIVILEKEQHE